MRDLIYYALPRGLLSIRSSQTRLLGYAALRLVYGRHRASGATGLYVNCLLALLWLVCGTPARAFVETGSSSGNPGTVTTFQPTYPAGIQNGDFVMIFIHHGDNTAPTTPAGWTQQTCQSTMPEYFNTIASPSNGFHFYTHSYSTGDPAPTFNGWGVAKNTSFVELSMQHVASLITCKASKADSTGLATAPDMGQSLPANTELVTVYDAGATGDNYSAASTINTLDKNSANQTTNQDPTTPLGRFVFGNPPSFFLYDLNIGPNGGVDPPNTTITLTANAANAGLQIALQPSAFATGVVYPNGSRERNAAGVYYFSQIDNAANSNWGKPFIDVVANYRSWLAMETACRTFNWDRMDNDLIEARTYGKRLAMGLNAMGTMPPTSTSWLYSSTACTNSVAVKFATNFWNQTYGPAKCTSIQTAIVDDANYQAAADDFMAKLAARYAAFAGGGQPIVRITPLGYGGLGTVELSLNNWCEGTSINSGACTQTSYWSGASNSWTQAGWTTSNAVSRAKGAQEHFENTAIADWPNTLMVNETTDTPNLPANGGGGGGTCFTFSPNNFNQALFADDATNHPATASGGKVIEEQSNALGCSASGGVGSCFYANDYMGSGGANIFHSAKLGVSYQYASAQSAVASCSSTSGTILYAPSTADCNVPSLMLALSLGANSIELYPADVTTALDAPWFQMVSNMLNGRSLGGFQ